MIAEDTDRQTQFASTPKTEGDEVAESVRNNVKRWLRRIEKAEKKFEDDYERMRDNMDFVAGLQWNGQQGIAFDKIVVNLTLRAVNQGVATLYARNPRVECRRRERMNFKMWDGKIETILMATQLMQLSKQVGMPLPPDIIATLNDFQEGRMRMAMVDKVAKTLELVLQHQIDTQTPRFKLQMKQLVRRVNVCGVGYIKVNFCREAEEGYNYPTQSTTRLSPTERLSAAMRIMERVKDGKVQDTSADIEQLKALVGSLEEHPLDTEVTRLQEHVVFDFPRATSIIPDPCTRTLKGWIGTRWVAEKFYFPLSYVNEFYEKDVKPDSDIKTYNDQHQEDSSRPKDGDDDKENRMVCVYEIHDLDTKSCLTVCKGYKDYLCEPEAETPSTRNFWNIFPVTFNDIEVEEGCKATIFPPSLVDVIKPLQKEWNRTREALRRHRKASAPKYLYPSGSADEEDFDRIVNAEDQEFVELKGLAPGVEPSKVVQALQTADIKPELYDTAPLREDTLLASGQQEANQGPPQPNITATATGVAEQSRMGVAASDVDGLDDSLTDTMQCAGEMCLVEMSKETVERIVGRGGVFPQENQQDFLAEIEVDVAAASSGKPNQMLELQKWERVSNILVQFGANPQAVIRETIHRFDEDSRLEPADFFPLPTAPVAGPQAGAPAKASPIQRRTSQGQGAKPSRHLPPTRVEAGAPQLY